ncbi:MAG: class A beta-lactamase-related serine hydrolase [Verrucomicrobiaceae bacterium]|nr:MAG: class A beta-lactamase-related serine hydrolase [Verrucomicrobiaceae bacterium]
MSPSLMIRPLLAVSTLLFLSGSRLPAAEPADISASLEPFLNDGKVPGLAAAVVVDGKIVAAGAAGVRKHGSPEKVTVGDKFHIGSCTKSMTGTLAAMLVKDGKIKWSSTVAEIFPGLRMNDGYKDATLLQLCSNTGGVPGDVPPELWNKLGERREKPEAGERKELVKGLLEAAPAYPPGKGNTYSNGGFSIAGAMLEKAGGKSYQELLDARLFKLLDIRSAGYGAAGNPRKVDQPWGHLLKDGNPEPVPPGPDADNPPAITPAGRVHLSVLDFAKYANLHLGTMEKAPLDDKQLDFLHTVVPPAKDYAVGWVATQRPWANGVALMHNGTNTMNHAVMWLAPKRKFAVVVMCNIDDAKACDDVAANLIARFLKQ